MKKYSYLMIIVLISSLVLTGCLLSNVGQTPTSGQSGIAYLTKGPGSLVGLWHFDEGSGTIANDSSGNFNDGILTGNTSWTSGKFDNALSFDGDGDYVDCGDISTQNWSGLTTEAWVYWDGGTLSGYAGVYYKGAYSDIGRLLINGAGKVLVQNRSGTYHSFFSDSNGDVPTNEWCHIAYVYDQIAGMEYIYVNGDKKGEQARNDDIVHNSTAFLIGYGYITTQYYAFFGLIDEVRIWDVALTPGQIEHSYSLGAIGFTKELTEVLPEPVGWVGDMPQVSIDTSVTFTMPITVNNQSLLNLNDAWVKDRLGAELEVVPYGEEDPFDETIGEATYYTKGKSEKVFIDWYLDIGAGSTETLTIVAKTDINPGGGNKIHQEYTSPDVYELNSGATLTFHVTVAGEDISLVVTTDGLLVEAVGEPETPLAIGDSYGGGIVAYIFQVGDPGYVGGEQHGLIAATGDQSDGAQWGCYGTSISGADGTAVGTGEQNTIDIEAGCTTAGTAADICANLSLGGYTDWFLPSKDELNEMYVNLYLQGGGGFADGLYWSSSEHDAYDAWAQGFGDGQGFNYKYLAGRIRAVRAF